MDTPRLPWVHPGNWTEQYGGMTKRELFAAMALQGMLASDSWYNTSVVLTTAQAVQYADALLTELAK